VKDPCEKTIEMESKEKTKEQLVAELTAIRQRVIELEALEDKHTQAEEALRESEAKYKTLVETSPDGIILADLQGRITFASETARQLWGSEHVEDLYGRSPFDFFAPEEHQKFEAYLQAALKEGVRTNVELTFIRQDGTRFAGETSAAVIRDPDGRPRALMGLVRDITDRKRMEESLRHSHHELEVIYNGMMDGLVVVDIDTRRFRRVNPAMCRMVGYTEEELLSMTVMDIHPREVWSRVSEDFETLAQGRTVTVEGIPVLRKDGSLFHADICTSLVAYDGRPCSTGFFHDITHRKRAEDSLRREYRVLRGMLQAQDRERQLVTYEIHDGLAQPLAGAAMQFESYEQLKNENPQQASHCFSAGLHLLKKSLTEARRLIAGLRPPILDEAGIVAAIGHLIHDVTSEDGPEIEFRSSVRFDRLDPSLENAIFRIAQEGLANVRRHSKSDRAEIRLVQEEEQVRIEVRDWGVGFDRENVEEKCFGLAGIRERARVLGGKATINSRRGEGTRIVVELPTQVSEGDLA